MLHSVMPGLRAVSSLQMMVPAVQMPLEEISEVNEQFGFMKTEMTSGSK